MAKLQELITPIIRAQVDKSIPKEEVDRYVRKELVFFANLKNRYKIKWIREFEREKGRMRSALMETLKADMLNFEKSVHARRNAVKKLKAWGRRVFKGKGTLFLEMEELAILFGIVEGYLEARAADPSIPLLVNELIVAFSLLNMTNDAALIIFERVEARNLTRHAREDLDRFLKRHKGDIERHARAFLKEIYS